MGNMLRMISEKKEKRKLHKNERLHQRKILVLGGFGYQNVGDEAQLNVVIQRLQRCFPGYNIKILSPNPDYTIREHRYGNVGEAPRIAFFKQGESPLYSAAHYEKSRGILKNSFNRIVKIVFLLKSCWIYFNARLLKCGLPTLLLSANAAGLLYDMRTAALIYFGGGGYLTGKTLSRLWDAILICKIAKLYDVPVVMSGQTIGVWNTWFNRRYAKEGFEDVCAITVRDPEESVKALKEIGLEGSHIYPVCDDALFCAKEEDENRMEHYYSLSRCDSTFREAGYVAVNMHYWGVFAAEEKDEVLDRLHKILENIISKTKWNILLVPMAPVDEETMQDYMKKHSCEKIRMLKYDYDFRVNRRILAEAKVCITMKHHPIIFAAGEVTPVISLNLSDYYEHKNRGALEILGLKGYAVTLEDENYLEKFDVLMEDVYMNYEEICSRIQNNLKELADKTEHFESELISLIETHMGKIGK